jgi:hypothetical protein
LLINFLLGGVDKAEIVKEAGAAEAAPAAKEEEEAARPPSSY